ncbi:hypothetical protein K439DRAFT_1389992 [Ramaria rubella]|nr:hypothetical protein K439DRAFT_1389992 [Ramaria rubella]
MSPRHPIIVVTGANSGIGFGICQRLIVQLSCPFPPNVLPFPSYVGSETSLPFSPTKHLTLVLACRSAKRANAARRLLLEFLNKEVARQRASPGYDGYAEEFSKGLCIDCLPLDLASMDSVFDFADEACQRYPYITHLILNAGMLNMSGLDILTGFKQLISHPMDFLTTPRYVIQPIGIESSDGLGLVWQCNVFGHYVLFRLLEPLLIRNPYHDSRIEWLSSLDAIPEDYDPKDPQLRQAKFSYQASKYQIDLLCAELARIAIPQNNEIRMSHLLVHPGVCHTSMTDSVLNFALTFLKILSFYVIRLCGSQNHPTQPYKGAVAPVHVTLAPITTLNKKCGELPQKFGSRSTAFGREYVGVDLVPEWDENSKHASDLLIYCDRLFKIYKQARAGSPSMSPTDSGIGID